MIRIGIQSLKTEIGKKLEETEDLDELVGQFTELVQEALDEIAPIRTFIVESKYNYGLSNETKELMKKRDHARQTAKIAESNQKNIKSYIACLPI